MGHAISLHQEIAPGLNNEISKALRLAAQHFLRGMDSSFLFYWEQNTEQRFTLVQFPDGSSEGTWVAGRYLHRRFWELEEAADDAPSSWDSYRKLFALHRPIRDFVICRVDENHQLHYLSLTAQPLYDGRGDFCGYCGVARDVTREKRMEDLASTFELAAIGISHVGRGGRFIHVNSKMCEMLGYSREELLELTAKQISHPDDINVTDAIRDQMLSGAIDHFKVEKRYLRKDGSTIWVALTAATKRGSGGEPLHDVSVVEDITARKEAEVRVQYLATHDEMTGLPNRTLFSQLLKNAVEFGVRYERNFAVLFIDLDRFKQINDSLGHEAGDILLKEMARRFRACLRSSDIVARLGGDEFVVLVQEVSSDNQVTVIARNLLSAAMKPVEIMEQECRVTASIGIAMCPRDGSDDLTIMKSADIAMYLAKEEGKNNFQFYSDKIHSGAIEKMALETQLRHALERHEFEIHYQAKVLIETGAIRGVEALLRWNNALLGSVSPAQFIPIAEELGSIIAIGRWVLMQSCVQNVAWQQQGLPPVCVSVNLSPRQFSDPDLVSYIAEVIAKTGIAPQLLELEITERMVMHNAERAVKILREIKALGVKIAIDDFGTGYSSLAQLKSFPVDTLKVDRSFIRELETNEEDRAITQAIITMSKTLGLNVVAEGVENAEQQSFLKTQGCDEIQGYFFSKPLSNDNFVTLLQNHQPAPLK
ncbi:MAG: EAL domain-containing protein [Pseudomonadota bacterium]